MRWRKILLATVVFLFTLEALLQLGAWILSPAATPPPAMGSRARVLCVGDSYTYGVGATAPRESYPARLQAILASKGVFADVVNAGLAGQNSRDVLTRLPAQLTPGTRVLCVLVGANDSWTRPSPVSAAEIGAMPSSADEATSGFQWRWRTGRLLALVCRFAWNSWSRTGDGASVVPTATGPLVKGRTPHVEPAAGFRLLATAGLLPAVARRPVPAPACPVPLGGEVGAVWQFLNANDYERAFAAASVLGQEHPDSPWVLHVLAIAASRCGKVAPCASAIDRLVQLAASHPSGDVVDPLLQALLATGRTEQAVEAARQRVAREPLSMVGWDVLQSAAFTAGLRDEFLRAAVETLSLSGTEDPRRTASVSRNLARWTATDDARKAATLIVGATLLDGDFRRTRLVMKFVHQAIPREEFTSVLGTAGDPQGDVVHGLQALIEEVYDGKDEAGWRAVLREHMTMIGEMARRNGTRVVVLSYPFYSPEVEPEQIAAAATLGASFVPVRERFDAELKARPRSDLFVRDGHCSDAGYAIVAEMVAEQIAAAWK